jgi:hypothetical protein
MDGVEEEGKREVLNEMRRGREVRAFDEGKGEGS